MLSPRAHTDPHCFHGKINPFLREGLLSGSKLSNSEELQEPGSHRADLSPSVFSSGGSWGCAVGEGQGAEEGPLPPTPPQPLLMALGPGQPPGS